MKKIILYSSFLVLHSSLCSAQDTIVYKSGEKIVVKVISTGRKIGITDSNGKVYYIYKEYLDHISFGNGTKLLLAKHDTVKQNNKVKPILPNYRPININAGVGASLITWALPSFDLLGGGGPEILSETPAYNCTIDYTLIKWISVGVGGAYQSLVDIPYVQEELINWETEQINRYNLSGRLIFHFSKKTINDVYAGIRIGVSIWTDQILSNTNYSTSGSVTNFMTFPSSNTEKESFQVLFGYRGLLFNNFGLHFETGIGTPYFIEAGISFRFNTQKDKTK